MDLPGVTDVAPPRIAAPGVPGDAWLAGGTWLFSEPQPDVRRLLDLQRVRLAGAGRSGPEGLEIAATCTLAELARFAAPPQWPATPLIGQCCQALLGSFKVWNMATVGGNICLALPAGPDDLAGRGAGRQSRDLGGADGGDPARPGRGLRHRGRA